MCPGTDQPYAQRFGYYAECRTSERVADRYQGATLGQELLACQGPQIDAEGFGQVSPDDEWTTSAEKFIAAGRLDKSGRTLHRPTLQGNGSWRSASLLLGLSVPAPRHRVFKIGPDQCAELLAPDVQDARVKQRGRSSIGRGDVDLGVRTAG
jgi:hypothetical protein